jgi:eukaryotic-like serine/threonine-protein kinase
VKEPGTPDRWREIERLYHETMAHASAERAAFLIEACAGDETLRREVQALVDQPVSAERFLDEPAVGGQGRVTEADTTRDLIGRRLGVYSIQGLIGAGGMGEVYRARDTRLGRDVAIKILPDAFAHNADRLARFEREARILASLNHPHIATIHGVEERGDLRALVMELVDGDTLAERIGRRSMPISDALTIARAVAEALEAAHEKGIIHRDLKPANIKVTPQGVVKVLDFGLAKGPAASGAPVAPDSPAITVDGTREGMILGTAAYMSPEQARGQAVDTRADIWAFGCLLYEMLTGRSAYAHGTVAETLAAILEREPDWSALPSGTPTLLRRLLTRCLEKDVRRRVQHIGDVRLEIEDLLSGAPMQPVDGRGAAQRASAIAATLVLLIAVGAVVWFVRSGKQPGAEAAPFLRLSITGSGPTTISISSDKPVAITPDGTRVVYIGNNDTQIFVRPLDQLEATAIYTGASPVNGVFVSPDGKWVGFREGNALKKMALTGGPAITLTRPVSAAHWASDDTIVFATAPPTGLRRIAASGGEVTTLTSPDPARGELAHTRPEMLPGGQAVLYTITATTGGADATQTAVLDLRTGTSKVVLRGGGLAQYVRSGHLVYAVGGILRAVAFDLARMETRGTPVIVVPRLAMSPQGEGYFAVAAKGTLAYVDASDRIAGTLVWVDRQGKEEPLGTPLRRYMQPRLAPDGARVAVAIGGDIWMWDIARRTLSQRTFDPANEFFPLWTPDGARLIFTRQDGSNHTLRWQAADGSGTSEPLGNPQSAPAVLFATDMTRDGTALLLYRGGESDLLMLSPQNGDALQPLLATPANEHSGVLSPNRRWLAYASDASGRLEVYVRPFPNVKADQWLISMGGGTRPKFAPGGGELFYEAPGGTIMAVRVDSGGGAWNASTPAKAFEGSYVTYGGGVRNYDISPDGRFLMVKPQDVGPPQIVVVQNWTEELKRLVPLN